MAAVFRIHRNVILRADGGALLIVRRLECGFPDPVIGAQHRWFAGIFDEWTALGCAMREVCSVKRTEAVHVRSTARLTAVEVAGHVQA